ncbi:pentatricopeptide repeat-containing protein At5g24830-like [Eucalyptus grandis]|nr:pentatricopeptide repeat-containing protein At5g24830-like [Eucalyptus grandis]
MVDGGYNLVANYEDHEGAACNLGRMRFALWLHDEMLRRECEPDIVTCTELIRAYCVRGDLNKAERLFEKIQKSGIPIDHIPLKILVNGYCKMGQLNLAFNLYKKWLSNWN